MKKLLIVILLIFLVSLPVSAMEFSAPEAPKSAQEYMPENTETFSEGLWQIIKAAISQLQPGIAEASGVCVSMIAIVVVVGLLSGFSDKPNKAAELAGVLSFGILMLRSSDSMIRMGIDTVTELSEYGKLLLPVMSAATAAQGGMSTATALYTGTTLFITALSTAITKVIVPMLYVYMALSVASGAIGDELLKNLQSFLKWLMTWTLKIGIYIFTGYISITGVVSGGADASAIKAAKLTISGFVPVVGSIISDASEAVLVSAGVMKSAAGVYGILAMLAILVDPFLRVGIQYLMLKTTAAICGIFGTKNATGLINNFAATMGFVLAMIAVVCIMLLISTVCFMKGVS